SSSGEDLQESDLFSSRHNGVKCRPAMGPSHLVRSGKSLTHIAVIQSERSGVMSVPLSSRMPAEVWWPHPGAAFDVIAIAASAGGLRALTAVFSELPADFPAAVTV